MEGDNTSRIRRGGSWAYQPLAARVVQLNVNIPDGRHSNLGFRLTRVVSPLERLAEAGQEMNREK